MTDSPVRDTDPDDPPTGSTDEPDAIDTPNADEDLPDNGFDTKPKNGRLTRALAFGVLPTLALTLGAGAGYEKYLQGRHAAIDGARVASVAAAKDITEAMLSYTPDTAASTLTAVRAQLSGSLRDSYTSLTDDVVIPGAQQHHITAEATVTAAASISASDSHAVVLVFVDQTITQGQDAPTATASTVRVTLDRDGTRWVATSFDPK